MTVRLDARDRTRGPTQLFSLDFTVDFALDGTQRGSYAGEAPPTAATSFSFYLGLYRTETLGTLGQDPRKPSCESGDAEPPIGLALAHTEPPLAVGEHGLAGGLEVKTSIFDLADRRDDVHERASLASELHGDVLQEFGISERRDERDRIGLRVVDTHDDV